MLTVSLTVLTDVNHGILNRPRNHSNEFALVVWWLLKVQSSENSSVRQRLIVLDKVEI